VKPVEFVPRRGEKREKEVMERMRPWYTLCDVWKHRNETPFCNKHMLIKTKGKKRATSIPSESSTPNDLNNLRQAPPLQGATLSLSSAHEPWVHANHIQTTAVTFDSGGNY
jgi:hypothetical protein